MQKCLNPVKSYIVLAAQVLKRFRTIKIYIVRKFLRKNVFASAILIFKECLIMCTLIMQKHFIIYIVKTTYDLAE